MAEELKLFGFWASPYTSRVKVALKLKGIEYENVEEDLSNKSPLLLKYNPIHKKVPVFLHHGKPIAESVIILEYIDETWKHNPILPKDPYDRAMARFWAKFIDEKLQPAVWKTLMVGENEREAAIEEAHQLLKTLENELKGKKFFGGDSLGFLDVAGNVIVWLEVSQEATGMNLLDKEKFPVLHEWCQRVLDDDSFKQVMPPKEKILAYTRARFAAFLG